MVLHFFENIENVMKFSMYIHIYILFYLSIYLIIQQHTAAAAGCEHFSRDPGSTTNSRWRPNQKDTHTPLVPLGNY